MQTVNKSEYSGLPELSVRLCHYFIGIENALEYMHLSIELRLD